MNNQFTQRVSDIITYSKEEANRLRNSYIGPEHLLLGLIREGEGKAIEILLNLNINLQDIKYQLENILKRDSESDAIYDANINFNESASKVLKLCILEAKLLKNSLADSEHILLAIMKVKNNSAFHLLESSNVTYDKIIEISLRQGIANLELPNRHALPKRNLLMIHLYSIISVQI